ncbi:MAG TPA: ATPase, T2SS/T4P/T4SS family [Tepidisphaeraceae bacterium]|jgi:type IV pilus assembly protein PilB
MIATATRKPLGQLLLDRGIIAPEQLQRALDEQRHSSGQKLLGEIIVERGMATEEQICEALADTYGVPFARVTPRVADPKAIGLLSKEFLEQHTVLPLFNVEGVLTVACAEPANVFLAEEIERITGKDVQLVAATAKDIRATLQTYLPDDKVFVIDDIIDEVRPEDFTLLEQKKIEDIADLEQAAGDSPVVKLVNYCVYNAVKDGASDIHIEPGDGVLRVRYRIDGHLVEKLRPPHQMGAALSSRIKIMAGLDIAERRVAQDGGIHVMMDRRPIDLRVSTMPGRFGEKVVIRVIDNDKASVNLEKLGFGYETLKEWRKLLALPNGIILVTGPTGSGKSTTLYACLQEINDDDINICTVEDPIEYNLRGINQFQINDKAGFTFTSALRALLRQDPDVMMIGEIRDGETARLATQAALTGHLIFSTLHTNDAPGAITRLYNLGIEPYLVGATVVGVLAQRLVRKLCSHCREEYEPTPNEKRQIERFAGPVEKLFKPKGCNKCRHLGYAGRVGVYELFVPDDATIEKISSGATLNDVRQAAAAAGMRSLRIDGLEKVKAGITTLDEVYRVTT